MQLPTPLVFDEEGPWAVALTEMTYDAQGFPNIPEEFSQIKLEALNRSSVYDATNMNLYIEYCCISTIQERYLVCIGW